MGDPVGLKKALDSAASMVGADAMALGMDSYLWTGIGISQHGGALQNSTTKRVLAGGVNFTHPEEYELANDLVSGKWTAHADSQSPIMYIVSFVFVSNN